MLNLPHLVYPVHPVCPERHSGLRAVALAPIRAQPPASHGPPFPAVDRARTIFGKLGGLFLRELRDLKLE